MFLQIDKTGVSEWVFPHASPHFHGLQESAGSDLAQTSVDVPGRQLDGPRFDIAYRFQPGSTCADAIVVFDGATVQLDRDCVSEPELVCLERKRPLFDPTAFVPSQGVIQGLLRDFGSGVGDA